MNAGTLENVATSRCTSLNLRRAARAASHFLEQYLQPVDLHSSQFGILNQVSRAGKISLTRLSEEMSLDRTTMTRNLQILQKRGLVEIALGLDRRVREIALTDKGKTLLIEALPLWQEAESALEEKLGKELRDTLLTLTIAIASLTIQ